MKTKKSNVWGPLQQRMACLVSLGAFVVIGYVAQAKTYYTTFVDTPVRKSGSVLAEVVVRLPRTGTPVEWLKPSDGATPSAWQHVQVKISGGVQEGYVREDNLSEQDPTQVAPIAVREQDTLTPQFTTVVATAATRAFTDFAPVTREYARRVHRQEVLVALARVAQIEQAITEDEINTFLRSQGLRTLQEIGDRMSGSSGEMLGDFDVSSRNTARLQAAQAVLVQSGGDTTNYQPLAQNFVTHPVERTELEQMSELLAVGLGVRYGGVLVDKPEGINEVTKLLYKLFAGSMGVDFFRSRQCRVSILNTPEVNAFSTPGCDIFVTRGAVQLALEKGNLWWLTELVGHEGGHVKAGDGIPAWQVSKAVVVQRVFAPDAPASMRALQADFRKVLDASCQGAVNLENAPPKVVDMWVERHIDRLGCASYEQTQEKLADWHSVRGGILMGQRPDYRALFGALQDSSGFANHPKNSDRVAYLDARIEDLRPTPSSFGHSDFPFSSYALPPIDPALKHVFDVYGPQQPVATACNRF